MNKLIALLLILSTPIFAADPDNVSLTQGQAAPYPGILFPIPRAQRVELLTIDFSTCTERLKLSNEDNTLYQERNTNLQVEVKELRGNNQSFFKSQTFGFIEGAVITILLAYAVRQATK